MQKLEVQMYQDEERIEAIFQSLCEQLESITIGELKDSAYRIMEDRAYYHEQEERRAGKQLAILLNERKQREVYQKIIIEKANVKRAEKSAKDKADAYRKAKHGF